MIFKSSTEERVVDKFKCKFQSPFYCPYCEDKQVLEIDSILSHFMWQHEFPSDITFETLYTRFKAVGYMD